jgi:hypothetical protein
VVVDRRKCRVWMQGGLTHPAIASLGDPLFCKQKRGF